MTMSAAEWTTRATSEAAFQDKVITLARLRGWVVHHCRPCRTEKGWRTAITGNAGFPDLVLAREGHVIVAELKSARGRLSDAQAYWLAQLSNTDPDEWQTGDLTIRFLPALTVAVWRISDLKNIAEVLA